MSACGVSERRLMRHLDGEGEPDLAVHVERCTACREKLETWRAVGTELRESVDAQLETLDLEAGRDAIRRAVVGDRSAGLLARLRGRWSDVWLLHRRQIAGLAAAAALGALTAPVWTWWWSKRISPPAPSTGARVVVESLEVGRDATAVVLATGSKDVMLIWVETRQEESSGDTGSD